MAYGVRQVPQNIMSVQFKLFDFMTLKQFAISIALLFLCFILFYFLPSPWNIVIPLFIVIIGGIVIFVPFNGEPFQEFLSSYLEAMISPQRRIWHKKGIILKSAAEKAQFYRYGNEGPTEKVNNFTFFDRFKKKNNEQQQLDTAEAKFLSAPDDTSNSPMPQQNQNTQAKKAYTPPAMHTQQQHSIQPVIGTAVSPKVMNNTVQLGNAQQQNSQPQANQQIQNFQQQQPTVNQNPDQPSFIKKDTPQVPQQNIQPQSQTPQPKKLTPEEEESAVRNFIFGSVEGYNENPIVGAVITLKNPKGETLEVLYTNSIGEFKTSYEYIAGNYELFVNADSGKFNEVIVSHNPIDPIPVLIRPSDFKEKQIAKNEEEATPVDTNPNDEIFTGSYDSNIFDLKQDYLEKEPPVVNSPIVQPEIKEAPVEINTNPQQPSFISAENNFSAPAQVPTQTNPNPNLVIPTAPPSHELMDKTSTYSHDANSMFDQMMNNRMTNDYQTLSAPTDPLANAIQHTSQNHQKIVNEVDILDYNTMANAAVPFEQNLVTLPNTVNGILVDPNGYGLSGALVRLYDKGGTLITSMNSDNTGRFYTYSPLPNNDYIMYVSKNEQNLIGFHVNMTGSVIPPKIISFTY